MDPIPQYQSHPPPWVPQATRDGDLGYHGFHPPRPRQGEDILDAATIKSGYIEPPFVTGEAWHGLDTWKRASDKDSKDGLESLQDLMEKVLERRAELYAQVELWNTRDIMAVAPWTQESTFKLPSRVTLNDPKRNLFLKELGDSKVPLHKLAKSVPHGTKNEELLDVLFKNGVPSSRSGWYIGTLGAIEIQLTARNKNNTSNNMAEWSNVLTTYIRKQLLEITLPVQRTSTYLKQVVKPSKLSDPKTREEWVRKFGWSLDLLRYFFHQGMLDQSILVNWIAAQCSALPTGTNLPQFAFVALMCDEYFDLIQRSRAVSVLVVEGCMLRLGEIEAGQGKDRSTPFVQMLTGLIFRFFNSNSDFFVSPFLIWRPYGDLIPGYITAGMVETASVSEIALLSYGQQPRDSILATFDEVAHRNQGLLFQDVIEIDNGGIKSCLEDVYFLNSITGHSPLPWSPESPFLPLPSHSNYPAVFNRRVQNLLVWATTSDCAGDHRPFVAANFFRRWRDASQSLISRPSRVLENIILRTKGKLASSTSAIIEIENAAMLFGELVKDGFVDYEEWLNGIMGIGQCLASGVPDPQLELLRQLPLYKPSEQLLTQRRIVLFGVRARTTPEELKAKAMRNELRGVLPVFFNGPPADAPFHKAQVHQLLSATKYEQVSVLMDWLWRQVLDPFLARFPSFDEPHRFNTNAYETLIEILSAARVYSVIFELNNTLLSKPLHDEMFYSVLDTIRRHLNIWSSMNVCHQLTESLLNVHRVLGSRDRRSRASLDLLLEVDQRHSFSAETRQEIKGAYEAVTRLLVPETYTASPTPSLHPLLTSHIQENNLTSPVDVGNVLWFKYRSHTDWAIAAWQAIITCIHSRSWNPSVPDAAMAHRFALLIWNIDQHLPTKLEEQIRQWFDGNEIAQFEDQSWSTFAGTCLDLVVRGTISAQTLMDGFVYRAWEWTSVASESVDGLVRAVRRSCSLARVILLCEDTVDWIGGRVEMSERLRLITARGLLLHPKKLNDLLEKMTVLVCMSANPVLEDSRTDAAELVNGISINPVIREALLCKTDALRTAFGHAVIKKPELKPELVAALKVCLGVSRIRDDDEMAVDSVQEVPTWASVLGGLNGWRFTRTALDVRLTLERLVETVTKETDQGSLRKEAEERLQGFSLALFDPAIGNEAKELLIELMKSLDGVVLSKLQGSGILRLASCFDPPPLENSNLGELCAYVDPARKVLELLITVRQARSHGVNVSHVDATRDQLFAGWMATFQALGALTPSTLEEMPSQDFDSLRTTACFLTRVFHFVMGVEGVWTGKLLHIAPDLALVLVHFAVVFGGHLVYDQVAFTMMLDTLGVLLDESPKDARMAIVSKLNDQYPINYLPPSLPPETRLRLSSFLPFIPMDKYAAYLGRGVQTEMDRLDVVSKIRSRPWEWVDNIDTPEEPKLLSTPVKNKASLPLELFEATSTGEIVVPERPPLDLQGETWTFRDNFASENILARSWRESHFQWEPAGGGEREHFMHPDASPAATSLSRSSAHASTSSRRQSPAQASTSRLVPQDSADLDMLSRAATVQTSGRGVKRKASVSHFEGDRTGASGQDASAAAKTSQVGKRVPGGKTKRK